MKIIYFTMRTDRVAKPYRSIDQDKSYLKSIYNPSKIDWLQVAQTDDNTLKSTPSRYPIASNGSLAVKRTKSPKSLKSSKDQKVHTAKRLMTRKSIEMLNQKETNNFTNTRGILIRNLSLAFGSKIDSELKLVFPTKMVAEGLAKKARHPAVEYRDLPSRDVEPPMRSELITLFSHSSLIHPDIITTSQTLRPTKPPAMIKSRPIPMERTAVNHPGICIAILHCLGPRYGDFLKKPSHGRPTSDETSDIPNLPLLIPTLKTTSKTPPEPPVHPLKLTHLHFRTSLKQWIEKSIFFKKQNLSKIKEEPKKNMYTEMICRLSYPDLLDFPLSRSHIAMSSCSYTYKPPIIRSATSIPSTTITNRSKHRKFNTNRTKSTSQPDTPQPVIPPDPTTTIDTIIPTHTPSYIDQTTGDDFTNNLLVDVESLTDVTLHKNLRMLSVNAQRRKWLSIMNESFSILCVQEAIFLQTKRFDEGFTVMSPNRDLLTWSSTKIIVLKNLDHIQILEIIMHKKRILLGNAHLSNHAASRKRQLSELKADLDHILINYEEANVIFTGDFNCESVHLKDIPLINFNINEKT